VHRYREVGLGRPARIRQMTAFSGIAPPGTLGCFSSSAANMRLAIFGRVLSKEVGGVRLPLLQTIPKPGYALPLVSYFNRILENVVPTAPIPLGEYPAKYGGRKRREYERAADSLRRIPLKPNDAEIKLFLKFEKDVRTDKPGRIPRCILPPDTRFLVECGRYVSPVEHRVYQAINKVWGARVVSKGENYVGVAQMFREAWEKYANPVSLDVDVSKMDQSFAEELMDLFLDMVADCSTDAEALRTWLKWTLRTKVRGRCDEALFWYNIQGTLASGMPFTSLAGVSVVTAIVFLFKEHYGVDLSIVDAGDDMTIIFDRKDVPTVEGKIAEWYARFGLTLEVGALNSHFEGIEFCQSHPCMVEGRWQMVRNPISAAHKDSASIRPLQNALQAAAWLEACGLGGLASQGGAPVSTSRYKMMLRSAELIKTEFLRTNRQKIRYQQQVRRSFETGGSYEWYGHGMSNTGHITDAARSSFERAFGIPPHVQRQLEAKYDSQTVCWEQLKGASTALDLWDVARKSNF